MLSLLIGCGLRRAELLGLTMNSIQLREEHWVIADPIGKGGHSARLLSSRSRGSDSFPPRARFRTNNGTMLGCKQKLRIAVNDNIGIEPTETV